MNASYQAELMKPDGNAENALEQLLWAYALGIQSAGGDPNTILDMRDLSQMYQSTCGVHPKRDELQKWVKDVPKFLRAHQEK